MKVLGCILGFLVQSVGLLICAPGWLLITIGGWIVDLGETLRLNGEN